jgi:PAS domain S-box-containing protein
MNRYPIEEAREAILSICRKAEKDGYHSREEFMTELDENPHIAAQGYNPFGKIFFWNTASARLYGYSEAAAINQNLFELILPPEMRPLALDMISCAHNTGRLPEAGACDLMRHNGGFVTVFSGHLMFNWEGASVPEFYCVDLPILAQSGQELKIGKRGNSP